MHSSSLNLDVSKRRQAGLTSLDWQPSLATTALATVDLGTLRAAPDFAAAVQATPPGRLYHAIKAEGLGDCKDIILALSNDQLTRILDYDVWQTGRPELVTALAWLDNYPIHGDSNTLFQRFSALEEEYQIALLEGKIRIYDEEEREALAPEIADRLAALPCRTLWYEILDDNPDVQNFVDNLIESSLAGKVEYAYSLLAHVAYDVPNENAFLLKQFRAARLEEDGFVSEEEGCQAFAPINFISLKKKLKDTYIGTTPRVDSGAIAIPEGQANGELFLDRVVFNPDLDVDRERLSQQLLYLSNSLASASLIEPDDRHGLVRILEQVRALVSLGLEFAADGDGGMAAHALRMEHPKTLFRTALSVIALVQQKALESIEQSGLGSTKRMLRYLQMQKWALLHHELDTVWTEILGIQLVEILRGLCNRYPMAPVLTPEDPKHITFSPITSVALLNEVTEKFTRILRENVTIH